MAASFVPMLINIALLLVGTSATLAAFGGETWTKGTEPIFQRITTRGRLSIICLLCALALGAIKEIQSSYSSEQLRRERDKATNKLNELGTELASTKVQLAAQTELTLLTVLSKDYPVKDCRWWLTLGGTSSEATDIIDYLASRHARIQNGC